MKGSQRKMRHHALEKYPTQLHMFKTLQPKRFNMETTALVPTLGQLSWLINTQ
jgi:hypothetical protein